jgi:hydroxymethylpyrimidine pyrophosphatase-like HAD family hydrolase
MTIRMVALDLDGTLLNRQKEISPGDLAAVQAARAAGVHVVIATGRTVGSAREIAGRIGPDLPVIACNGAICYDERGEVLAQRPIPLAIAQQVVERLRSCGYTVQVQTPQGVYLERPLRNALLPYWRFVRTKLGASVWSALGRLRYYWFVNRFHRVGSLVKFLARQQPTVLKLEVYHWGSNLGALAEQLTREFPQLEVTKSGRDIVEITHGGVSKAWALQRLADARKVPSQAVMAVGDAWNDVAMLQYAGLGVAMAGAPAEVRAAARAVTGSNEEGGVAQAIYRYVLNKGEQDA